MRKLIFIPLLFIGLFIHAQTISWKGGAGKWHDPDNWTPNRVPHANDMVSINVPGSEVYIYKGVNAVAQRIDISSNNELSIEGNLSVVANASSGIVIGINNFGYISNSGTLLIQATSSSNSSYGYRGNNNSLLDNEASGNIDINGFSTGIFLVSSSSSTSQAQVYNEGVFEFSDLSFNAIDVVDSYLENNDGVFNFENLDSGINVTGPSSKVINSGHFNFLDDIGTRAIQIREASLQNQSGGIIMVESGHPVLSSIAVFDDGMIENRGHIDISSGRTLSITDAYFNNLSGSSIYVDASTGSSAIVINAGELVNEGLIETYTAANFSAIQISNQGYLKNINSGTILTKGSGNGAILVEGADFLNTGLLSVYSGIGPSAIHLRGSNPSVRNTSCGLMDFRGGEIQLSTSSGTIANKATILLKDPHANHVINGQLNNDAIISDPYDRLGKTNVSNSGLITRSLQGPLTNGSPISVPLLLGGTSNINSIAWYTSPNGANAGSYNMNTNTYTPNSHAVGDKELWIRVDLAGCGIDWFNIPVQNPTPLQSTGPSVKPNEPIGFNINPGPEEWIIFPNPAVSDLTLTYPGSQNKDLTLELWNTTGQLISRQHFSAEAGHVLQIERPHSAKAGTYRLRIIGKDMEPMVRTIVWQ